MRLLERLMDWMERQTDRALRPVGDLVDRLVTRDRGRAGNPRRAR